MQRQQAPHRIGWSATVLGLCALAGAALADEQACVLEAIDAVPGLARASQPGSGPLHWRLLQREQDGAEHTLSFECDGDRLARLNLLVMPGASRSLMLVAEAGVPMDLIRQAETEATRTFAHGTTALQAFAVNGAGELLPWDSSPTGNDRVQWIKLTVSIDPSVAVGQRQELVLFPVAGTDDGAALRLTLESGPEERLFRDDFHFQIDPTLSQFSFRTPARRPNPHAPAPEGAGASL